MRKKRVELEQAVIAAARTWARSGWPSDPSASADLSHAVIALNEYEAAEITGAGARWVEGSPETSEQAARLAAPIQGSTRHAIIGQLMHLPPMARPGLTDEQLERRLGMKHQTVSSARNWLTEAGWLRDSGIRRRNTSRRPAVVWELTPAAWRRLKEPT